MADNNIQGDFCDCGCGLEFIPQTVGYRFIFIDGRADDFCEGYLEWEMIHDLWINYIPIKDNVLLWGEFKNLIMESHLDKPNGAVWTHLFNAFCDEKKNPEPFNTRIKFVVVN